MVNSFWHGRKIFLTGHTGFKGSWMSLWLEALGADVTGYALSPPTEPSLFESGAGRWVPSARFLPTFAITIISKARSPQVRPEVVIHMAAQTVVRRGYEDPIGLTPPT